MARYIRRIAIAYQGRRTAFQQAITMCRIVDTARLESRGKHNYCNPDRLGRPHVDSCAHAASQRWRNGLEVHRTR